MPKYTFPCYGISSGWITVEAPTEKGARMKLGQKSKDGVRTFPVKDQCSKNIKILWADFADGTPEEVFVDDAEGVEVELGGEG